MSSSKPGLVAADCRFLGRPLGAFRSVCHLIQIGTTDLEQCRRCQLKQPFVTKGIKQITTQETDSLVASFVAAVTQHRSMEKVRLSLSKGSPQRHELWNRKKGSDRQINDLKAKLKALGVQTPEALVPATLPAVALDSSVPSRGHNPASRLFVTRDGEPAPLCGLYQGASLFMILSGPSLRSMPLDKLNRRGVITMGVNNSPAVVRTNLWTYGDKTSSFHHGIWRDPAILKFMPSRCFGNKLRVKEDGHFVLTSESARDLPGVVGYQRNCFFDPDAYLHQETVNWGNSSKTGNDKHPHVINIMFAAMRIAFALGFKRIFLLGADFKMVNTGPIYAFDQGKNDQGAIDGNNASYIKLNHMFNLLAPKFRQSGHEVFNCTPNSGLLAFPSMDLVRAIDVATTGVPDELDTADWYTSNEGRPVKKPRRKRRAKVQAP